MAHVLKHDIASPNGLERSRPDRQMTGPDRFRTTAGSHRRSIGNWTHRHAAFRSKAPDPVPPPRHAVALRGSARQIESSWPHAPPTRRAAWLADCVLPRRHANL